MIIFSSHDWPDADCIKILSGIKKAMAPHSRVLVRKPFFNFTLENNKNNFAPFRRIHPPSCKPSS